MPTFCCLSKMKFLVILLDTFLNRLSYKELIGGIQLFSKQHYIMVNGYSNQFWGWGGEDDNLYTRIKAKGAYFYFPSAEPTLLCQTFRMCLPLSNIPPSKFNSSHFFNCTQVQHCTYLSILYSYTLYEGVLT